MPTAAPELIRQQWVPPVDVDAPLSERAIIALEAALQKRRDQAHQLRAPQPMGLCLAAASRAQQPPSEAADSHDLPDDDRMDDVQSDAMSASDFGALSHASMDDDAPPPHADAASDPVDDDDDLARFL
ncbi:hypothetical protein FGB62_33g174 [Gracilaria domingensis]|nr:hypothetical protein FGB62_33g174 [Gracilaria domingensis]